jgi:hypothetical protein
LLFCKPIAPPSSANALFLYKYGEGCTLASINSPLNQLVHASGLAERPTDDNTYSRQFTRRLGYRTSFQSVYGYTGGLGGGDFDDRYCHCPRQRFLADCFGDCAERYQRPNRVPVHDIRLFNKGCKGAR